MTLWLAMLLLSADAAPLQRKTAVAASVNPDQAALGGGGAAKPWSIITTFGTIGGLGTFLIDQTNQAFVGSQLVIEPGYVFQLPWNARLRLSARGLVSWEYTPPNNPSGRRVDWWDLLIGASTRVYQIPKIDVDLWASYRMVAPISLPSIQAGLVTAALPGLGASRNFAVRVSPGWTMSFTLRYDFIFRKNFNLTTVPVYPVDPGARDALVITRAEDVLVSGGQARGFPSTSYIFTNALTFSWSPIEVLSLSAFVALSNAFHYSVADYRDVYTSPYAIPGPGRSDLLRTNIDLTWTVLPMLLLSGGVFTVQPPFRPDNRAIYNPFFNVEAAGMNYTTLYLSVTALL